MDGTSVHEVNRPIPLGEMEIGFVIDERSVRVAAEAFENLLPSPHVVLKVTNVPRQLQNSGPLMSEGPSTVTIERGTPVDVVPSPWVVFQQDNTLRLAHSPDIEQGVAVPWQTRRHVAKRRVTKHDVRRNSE